MPSLDSPDAVRKKEREVVVPGGQDSMGEDNDSDMDMGLDPRRRP